MVQQINARVSDHRRRTKQVEKRCQFCGRKYKGSAQSKYCSKTHTEQASRVRKDAMIDALAGLLYSHSQSLTRCVWGRAFQITEEQARRKSEQCIRANYTGFSYHMQACGYTYSDADRRWHKPPLLT